MNVNRSICFMSFFIHEAPGAGVLARPEFARQVFVLVLSTVLYTTVMDFVDRKTQLWI